MRRIGALVTGAATLTLILAGLTAGVVVSEELTPGTTRAFHCATVLTGVVSENDATLDCASPTPAPTPTPTPSPTPAPVGTSLWLVNPDTDQRVRQLNNGDTVTNPFALEVVTSSTGSVVTTLDGGTPVNENNPPFAPCSDQGGDFAACAYSTGTHSMLVRVYSGDNGSGTLLLQETDTFTVAGVAPTPTPTAAPSGPSGLSVPGVKAGWQRVGFSQFDTTIPFGSWNGDPEGALMGRASGTDTSGNGTYRLSEISQHDGMLDCRMRRLSDGTFVMGTPMNKAPNPSNDPATAPRSLRVTSAMKVLAPAPDFKIAHMVAKYGTVRLQEIDWPEVRLRDGATASAWLHLLDGGSGKHFPTDASIYEWHTYTTEFVSGQSVRVYLDGVQIGSNTNASLIGTDPVHWIIQNETAIGVTLNDGREAHVLIDWVTIDIPN